MTSCKFPSFCLRKMAKSFHVKTVNSERVMADLSTVFGRTVRLHLDSSGKKTALT